MNLTTKKLQWVLLIVLTFLGCFVTAKEIPINILQEATIIDVRSPAEFANKSNPASINIPLNELESRLSTLNKEKTIIVCCASGRRSAIAESILKKNGFSKIINAGSWRDTIL